jgi:heme exporter protein D
MYAAKYIAIFAAAILGICTVIMITNLEYSVRDEETMIWYKKSLLDDHAWLDSFTRYALVSSVPVLCCAAFYGIGNEVWIALVPALMYLFNTFIYLLRTHGFGQFLGVIFSPLFIDAAFYCAVLAVWAALYAVITLLIHKFINRQKTKNERKRKLQRQRRYPR